MTHASEVGACLQAMARPNTDVVRNRLQAGSYLFNPRHLAAPPPEARA